MSMHYAGETGYGLFLNEEEADAYAKAYAEKNETDDDIYTVFYDNGASFFSDDNYDMRNIIHLKSRATDTDDMDDFVTGAFFYAQKQGSILVNDEKNCYSSLSEMANEFQETLGEYLPNDFDYEAHLCWFCGANFS